MRAAAALFTAFTLVAWVSLANYTLSEIQKEYGAEASSLSEDPLLDADHVPASSSPVIGRGLGKFYDEPSVNIGVHLH